MSVKDLRVRFREQLMVRKLVDQTIGPKITITPIEVHDYYERYINEFVQPEVVTLRNILIKPKENVEVEKTLGLAKDILKRLRDGEDFAALAKEYSDGPNAQEGGLMIDVKKGDLLPEIEVIVFNLKKGEMSDIVQTSLGYHIFKVEERKERRTKELSEVKHEVEEAIFREKVNTKLRGWIDGLKENAYIEFK
jgi:parvulin-like peptidyl-prolyl isomerase